MRGGVAAGIGPFAQGGLDEVLNLAIGPEHIGPCADMFQVKVATSSGKGFRDIAATIIGHDTGHFHTEPLVSGLYQATAALRWTIALSAFSSA